MSVTYATVHGRLVEETRNGVVTEYVPDTLGNVIKTTDESGNVTSETTYWPFGEVRTQTGTNPSPWGFCGVWGYLTDAVSRMYVRARHYRADTSRWLTTDQFWPWEPVYSYANNLPATLIDPSGLFGYGNYCGTRNGNAGTDSPINDVDACCKVHDDCLGTIWDWCNPLNRCQCDCALANCVARTLVASCGKDLKCLCGALAVWDYAATNCALCPRLSPAPLPPLILPAPISTISRLCYILG